jgi:hypothetical protein
MLGAFDRRVRPAVGLHVSRMSTRSEFHSIPPSRSLHAHLPGSREGAVGPGVSQTASEAGQCAVGGPRASTSKETSNETNSVELGGTAIYGRVVPIRRRFELDDRCYTLDTARPRSSLSHHHLTDILWGKEACQPNPERRRESIGPESTCAASHAALKRIGPPLSADMKRHDTMAMRRFTQAFP